MFVYIVSLSESPLKPKCPQLKKHPFIYVSISNKHFPVSCDSYLYFFLSLPVSLPPLYVSPPQSVFQMEFIGFPSVSVSEPIFWCECSLCVSVWNRFKVQLSVSGPPLLWRRPKNGCVTSCSAGSLGECRDDIVIASVSSKSYNDCSPVCP